MDDLIHDFSDLSKIVKRIDLRIKDLKARAIRILQMPQRLKDKFDDTVNRMKAVAENIKLSSFKLPTYSFSLTSIDFENLQGMFVKQIEKKVIDYGKTALKDIAKKYGGTFI